MKKLFLLIFILAINLTQGQGTAYSGIVLADEFPLFGATITVAGSILTTTTDFDGKFEVYVPHGHDKLTISYTGYQTINVKLDDKRSITINMTYPHERGIWLSVGSLSDISFAPYGISISNGQEEQNLLHFESFQEKVSLKLAVATDFVDNLYYETKFTYHNSLINSYLYNTSFEYVKKDYTELKFTEYNISTKIKYLESINSLLTAKIGVQNFNNQNGIGGALGLERSLNSYNLQYGVQSGYWNDYFTYEVYARKFIYKDLFSLIVNYERIDKTNFFVAGIHYLFKTRKPKY
jgi:hypothetical protein